MAILITFLLSVIMLIAGCNPQPSETTNVAISGDATEFVLQTSIADGHMAFVGRGGEIEGIVNPDLVVEAGRMVRLTIINGDGMSHDLSIPDLGLKTPLVNSKGDAAQLSFTAGQDQKGIYPYFCTVSGHRQAGMAGRIVIGQVAEGTS